MKLFIAVTVTVALTVPQGRTVLRTIIKSLKRADKEIDSGGESNV